MFGIRLSKVFKSRWHALLWSSLVLLTAYCSVPAEHENGDAEAIAALVEASKQAEQIHGEKPQEQTARHVNPWAKNAD